MAVRIGINGVGRIGRNLWRIVHTGAPDVEVAAVNDTADVSVVASLLRYDYDPGPIPRHGGGDHLGRQGHHLGGRHTGAADP
jgi:glyceraldehyde-3-phosphate dehydrogenase (EC 1.2.1.12)